MEKRRPRHIHGVVAFFASLAPAVWIVALLTVAGSSDPSLIGFASSMIVGTLIVVPLIAIAVIVLAVTGLIVNGLVGRLCAVIALALLVVQGIVAADLLTALSV